MTSQNQATIGFKEPAFAGRKMGNISSFDPKAKPGYGGCTCPCHADSNCVHVTACCWPGKKGLFDFEPMEPLGQHLDIFLEKATRISEEETKKVQEARVKQLDDLMKMIREYAAMTVWQSRMMGTPKGYEVERMDKDIREILEKAIK